MSSIIYGRNWHGPRPRWRSISRKAPHGQTEIEQARILSLARRSLLETVACQHIINRRKFLQDPALLRKAYNDAMSLSRMLQGMRSTLVPQHSRVREDVEEYSVVGAETE